jgi:hypothetical protein
MDIQSKSMEDVVRANVMLGKQSASGWYAVKCAVCNDHSARGGFLFSDGFCIYSDFNCGVKFKYEEGTGKISRKAREVLEAFGITRTHLNEITSALFRPDKEPTEVNLEQLTKVKLFTPEVAFPDKCFRLLSEGNEEAQIPIVEYLLNRSIDPEKTDFFYSLDKKFVNRVIIPYWRDGKLIYWQARSILDGVKPRYLNCEVSKEAIIYGYDKLHSYESAPLFVTEGVFNAIIVDGISIMSADLNAAKLEVLKRTKRRLIFVRDRDARGDKLSQTVLENGWEITTVDPRVNDINDSVTAFGLPFTAFSLIKNARSPDRKLQSSIELNLWGLEDRLRNRS